jgi:hypothetical protein
MLNALRRDAATRRFAVVSIIAVALPAMIAYVGWTLAGNAVAARQVAYHVEHERLERERIAQIRAHLASPAGEPAWTDGAFALLEASPAADHSPELATWRARPASPGRTEVARAWLAFAADEAATLADRHASWTKGDRAGRYRRAALHPDPPAPQPPATPAAP